MRIQLNGDPVDTTATTLGAFLDAQGFGDKTVATAINGNFVPAPARAEHPISDGDLIEVLAPMQGG